MIANPSRQLAPGDCQRLCWTQAARHSCVLCSALVRSTRDRRFTMIELLVLTATFHRALRFTLRAVPSLGMGLLLCGGCVFSYEGPKLGRYGDGLAPKPPLFLTLSAS